MGKQTDEHILIFEIMKSVASRMPVLTDTFLASFVLLCIYYIFLLEGLMSLLRDMGKGYLALCSYNCKEAIHILSHLPSHHYNTGWVLCHIGRAYFELAEYMQVSIGMVYFSLFCIE